jgi:hypothetical protein
MTHPTRTASRRTVQARRIQRLRGGNAKKNRLHRSIINEGRKSFNPAK